MLFPRHTQAHAAHKLSARTAAFLPQYLPPALRRHARSVSVGSTSRVGLTTRSPDDTVSRAASCCCSGGNALDVLVTQPRPNPPQCGRLCLVPASPRSLLQHHCHPLRETSKLLRGGTLAFIWPETAATVHGYAPAPDNRSVVMRRTTRLPRAAGQRRAGAWQFEEQGYTHLYAAWRGNQSTGR